jgi:hypothetical protein
LLAGATGRETRTVALMARDLGHGQRDHVVSADLEGSELLWRKDHESRVVG